MWSLLTGEFFLRPPFSCANGGFIITLRTLYLSIIVYLILLGVKNYLEPGSIFKFDRVDLLYEIQKTVPWYMAIFGSIYAALYTRFASQWSYLADLYNQIVKGQFEMKLKYDEWFLSHKSIQDDYESFLNEFKGKLEAEQTLVAWKAGFIEDAEDLHLATKRIFRPAIKKWLMDERIRSHFNKYTLNGEERSKKLLVRVNKDNAEEQN